MPGFRMCLTLVEGCTGKLGKMADLQNLPEYALIMGAFFKKT
jgi:hypothetical protein